MSPVTAAQRAHYAEWLVYMENWCRSAKRLDGTRRPLAAREIVVLLPDVRGGNVIAVPPTVSIEAAAHQRIVGGACAVHDGAVDTRALNLEVFGGDDYTIYVAVYDDPEVAIEDEDRPQPARAVPATARPNCNVPDVLGPLVPIYADPGVDMPTYGVIVVARTEGVEPLSPRIAAARRRSPVPPTAAGAGDKMSFTASLPDASVWLPPLVPGSSRRPVLTLPRRPARFLIHGIEEEGEEEEEEEEGAGTGATRVDTSGALPLRASSPGPPPTAIA